MRVRVQIDLTKPLERGRALHVEGQSLWVYFKYEKLPTFCFDSGCIVYGPKGCQPERNMQSLPQGGEKLWAVWLQARPGKTGYRVDPFTTCYDPSPV